MGFLGGVGSLVKGIGKAGVGTASAVGKAGVGISGGIGKSLGKQFNNSSGLVLGSVLTGAVAGGLLADQDGQVDPRTAALKGGAVGALAAAVPGGAAFGAGFGVAATGAAVTGVNALGAVGNALTRPMTKGERAIQLLKEDKTLTEAQLLKKGAVAGSKEAVDIGLTNISDLKLSNLAVPMLVGSSIIKGIGDGIKTFEKSRMGTNDGMLRRATPTIPIQQQSSGGGSYSNNAGATGDLVFSMFNNR